ncbi:MAG: peptidylprolyl isomerase [Elusimicrobia bacterium]|nr:peptidylprolyl isomerase [Elusimicrobiota bacterium]
MNKNMFFLALCFIAVGPLTAAKLTNRPIAIVDGETILLSDLQKNWEAFQDQQKENGTPEGLNEETKKFARQKIFDQMIDDKVLQAEAKKRKIRVPQRDLENGILQVKARFLPENGRKDLQIIVRRQMAAQGENGDGTPDLAAAWKELSQSNPAATKEAEATFKSELAKEGIDAKKFNDRIRDQLSVVQLSSEIVRERVKPPSDDAVKNLFAQLSAKLAGKEVSGLSPEAAKDLESMAKYFGRMTAEQVHARHILLSVTNDQGQPTGWEKASPEEKAKVRKKMEDLQKQIKNGADFAGLAEKNSVDKGSAVKGGDLDFFARGQMVPAFEKAAFSLKEGQVSDIVETQFGLHLIKVIEKKAATTLRYDQAENDLREYLFRSSQQSAFEEYVAGLRKTSDVKIMITPEELAGL